MMMVNRASQTKEQQKNKKATNGACILCHICSQDYGACARGQHMEA